ncbi:MAG: class I SAM-dependent methyltransferase [Betaproteobacteria bacterium]|nr:class I SAM-dependent methyltransferase [Betaproteobacteria bacterium]
MSATDNLIKFKTDAWKDPTMVAWYAGRMVEQSGTVLLNNLLEIGYCEQFAKGKTLLDIGIGTGRASLPLARNGFEVTGVDSSRAMLDETQRQAGSTPITLLEGDVRNVPVAEGKFDTVMALNVMTHFPNWREILAHWVSKANDGGTVVFDVYSLDHNCAATGKIINEQDVLPQDDNYTTFNLRIKVNDLIEEADHLGLTVKAVVPYRGFMSGTDSNLFIRPTLDGEKRWERLLTWLAEDKSMLDFALFLERNFLAHLTSAVSGKLMVVLEKRANAAANSAWKTRNDDCNKMLREGMTLERFAEYSGQDAAELKLQLNVGAKHIRSRYLLYRILKPAMNIYGHGILESYLDPQSAEIMKNWLVAEHADDITMQVAESWTKFTHRGNINIAGVEMSQALVYTLFPDILVSYFGIFKGQRS